MTYMDKSPSVRGVCVALALCFAGATVTRAAPLTESVTPLERATNVKAQPLLLLAKFPNAGPGLAQYVAQAMAKQPGIFDAILSILPDTSIPQASAIAAGVVRALRGLVAKEPALVKEIVAKVQRSNNVAFKTTFFAIGPQNILPTPHFASIVPDANPLMVGQMGEPLPIGQGRMGHEAEKLVYGEQTSSTNQMSDNEYFSSGTIVALISSNAASNGTGATSPTH